MYVKFYSLWVIIVREKNKGSCPISTSPLLYTETPRDKMLSLRLASFPQQQLSVLSNRAKSGVGIIIFMERNCLDRSTSKNSFSSNNMFGVLQNLLKHNCAFKIPDFYGTDMSFTEQKRD